MSLEKYFGIVLGAALFGVGGTGIYQTNLKLSEIIDKHRVESRAINEYYEVVETASKENLFANREVILKKQAKIKASNKEVFDRFARDTHLYELYMKGSGVAIIGGFVLGVSSLYYEKKRKYD